MERVMKVFPRIQPNPSLQGNAPEAIIGGVMATMLRRMTAVVLATFVLLSPSACRRSQPESQTARVDKLFAVWNSKDSPGCAVGISRNGAIVYQHGYGMANLELNVPITPETVFAIASITKSFTAMSVLLAAAQGKLSLDDEVQKYIPEWRDRDDHITIRHLLTHTSGLRDAFALLGWAPLTESAGDYNEAIARILARQRGLNFAPGTEYQYNNGGYNLLATILKRATGQSLGEFADTNIFKPLGMTHTHVHDDVPMLVPNRASGYTRYASGWRAAKVDGGIVGNTGMYSTVGDLLLWEENFEKPRVGTAEIFAAMQKPSQYRGLTTIEGSGGDQGIASQVARFPDQHFAVAVLCNEDNIVMGGMSRVDLGVLTNGIADIYFADALSPAEAAIQTAPPPTPVKLSDAELSEKTGLYKIGGVDYPVRISVDYGRLLLRSYYGDDFDFELMPVGVNRFLLRNSILFEFIPATPGRSKGWHVGEGKDTRDWQLVTFAPPAADIRSYAGEFRSEEIAATYTVEARDSALVVRSAWGSDIPIAPFSKDVFVGDFVGIVKFSRDSGGVITGFTLNREKARGVRFDRVR
jgi:CubicO group peptidase (beta-lactamase class C family)